MIGNFISRAMGALLLVIGLVLLGFGILDLSEGGSGLGPLLVGCALAGTAGHGLFLKSCGRCGTPLYGGVTCEICDWSEPPDIGT